MDSEEIAKRTRAARGYAGISREQLAQKVGMSLSTITRIEKDSREAKTGYGDQAAIARACGLPAEWFTADFQSLGPTKGDIKRLEKALGHLGAEVQDIRSQGR